MKKITLSAAALIILLSSFGGCENSKPAVSGPSLCGTALDMNAGAMEIQGTWIFIGHGPANMSMADCKPASVTEMSIEFNGDGNMSATSSCNSATANYTAAGGKLLLSGLGFTEMLCGESTGTVMVWETKFMKGLQTAAAYEFTGNALHLKTNSGNDLFFLKAS